jgi:hypothetical protein
MHVLHYLLQPARRRLHRPGSVIAASLAMSLAVALTFLSPGAVAAVGTVTRPEGRHEIRGQVATTPFNAKILSARAGMTTALRYLTQHQHPAAITALRTLRARIANAHQATMTLMGPGRVLSMLNLEHQLATKLLPPFNGLTSSTVVNALQTTLTTTFADRTALLNKVVALPQDEGAGATYDDSEADTLPIYDAEVNAYTAALAQSRLTAQGRTALVMDLAKVRITRLQFARRFGGGE